MKRVSIFFLLTVLMLCVGACGEKASKQFKAMEEEILSIENQINTISDCDDLQMLNFSILGLRTDLDNLIQSDEIPDTEISQLEEMLTGLEATWGGKWSAFECEQVFSDDEMDTSGEEDDEYRENDVL